jgi:NADH:ubiquinone oxidoreductase subunit 3 (subunit A)
MSSGSAKKQTQEEESTSRSFFFMLLLLLFFFCITLATLLPIAIAVKHDVVVKQLQEYLHMQIVHLDFDYTIVLDKCGYS